MADAVHLTGAAFRVRHGLLPEEHLAPQTFTVDVSLWLDPARTERLSDLIPAADYRTVWEHVRAVMEGPRQDLLETLAEHIAERLLVPPILKVSVTVRKERPPLPGPVASVAATVERSRDA